jgi:N-carbamoyl-L-amino-acid hydrolase
VRRHGLARIGYRGEAGLPLYRPHAHVELHIEQGPVLDAEGITIGAVENLQGISWHEVSIVGESNHAGTSPMRLRHDAGYCAAAIGAFLRTLARDMGGNQVCTMGSRSRRDVSPASSRSPSTRASPRSSPASRHASAIRAAA